MNNEKATPLSPRDLETNDRGALDTLKQWISEAVSESVEHHTAALRKQLEAYLQISKFLEDGVFPAEMHGWPVSPDFALRIVQLIYEEDYDLIVEFGSGTSTAIIARSLRSRESNGLLRIPYIAIEHSAHYHRKTQRLLAERQLDGYCNVVLAPLVDLTLTDGVKRSYYDCRKAFLELASSRYRKALLVVDGPPSTTGAEARYPAVPMFLEAVDCEQLDVLLDDFDRSDEKKVSQHWLRDLKGLYEDRKLIELPFEKGAALIRVAKPTTPRTRLTNPQIDEAKK